MGWNPHKPAATSSIRSSAPFILNNFVAIEAWTEADHYGLADALSGCHNPGQCSVIAIDTSANIETLTDVACAFAYATDINDFGYNDGTEWTVIGGPVEAGTKMVFYEDVAPTGWTIDNTVCDKLLYVTKGSELGGETGGAACSSGSWTLTGWTGQSTQAIALDSNTFPAHTHAGYTNHPNVSPYGTGVSTNLLKGLYELTLGYSGSSASHSHSLPTMFDASWRPSAYCMIICTKD